MTTALKIKEMGYTLDLIKYDTAEYSEQNDTLIMSFIYSENNPLSDFDRQKIKDVIRDDCGTVVNNIEVKFNKSCFDSDVIRQRISEYIETGYKALKFVFEKEDIIIEKLETGARITFKCVPMAKQVLLNKHFEGSLLQFLNRKFFIPFEIIIDGTKKADYDNYIVEQTTENDLSTILAQERKINKMETVLGNNIAGRQVTANPEFINCVSLSDNKEITIAGVVGNFLISTYNKKTKDAGNIVEMPKVTFTLEDASGKMDIIYFPRERDLKNLETLTDGTEVAVTGSVSSFRDKTNIRAMGINYCEVLTKELTYIFRKANDKYRFVKPSPIVQREQMDLFSALEKREQSDYWAKHDSVVVFDLETTGLDANSCAIIEIGAVKIVKGSITETFQTLVNPQTPIPPEITTITHIDDEMVMDAPTIDQVMPDFYKFVGNSVLSAYNIAFDYQFLNIIGHRLRFRFVNEQIDTLRLARDKVPSLSNYKLGTVVKALNITLENAHRALADAEATAKVFLKLA